MDSSKDLYITSSLSISPATCSFSSDVLPLLNLTLTLHSTSIPTPTPTQTPIPTPTSAPSSPSYSIPKSNSNSNSDLNSNPNSSATASANPDPNQGPITIYTGEIDPFRLVVYSALTITDLETGAVIPQRRRTPCVFEPPTKVTVTLDESKLHTLTPGVPVTITRAIDPFASVRGPAARGIAGGVEGRSQGDATTGRAKGGGYPVGISGLEVGRRYVVRLREGGGGRGTWRSVRWWDYGTKEELLARGLDARKVRYRAGPHGPLRVDDSGCLPFVLECVA